MSEQPETPFFPVPVRWFEIPMNTARWGFMRLSDVTESIAERPEDKRVEHEPTPSSESISASKSHVGTLLNVRA